MAETVSEAHDLALDVRMVRSEVRIHSLCRVHIGVSAQFCMGVSAQFCMGESDQCRVHCPKARRGS
jgi:hypothetical protein